MDFLKEPRPIKILSVHELQWKRCEKRDSSVRRFHALSYRIKGNAVFKTEHRTIHTRTGEIAYVPKGVSYSMEHDEEHLYVVHFDMDNSEDLKNIEKFSPSNNIIFQNFFKNMYTIWTQSQFGYKFDATAIFYKILSELNYNHYKTKFNKSEKLTGIISYIKMNYSDPNLTVEFVAETFDISSSYLRRIFTESIGIPPIKYINKLRLDRAIELLNSGYYSISDIASLSGFQNAKYFSTIIKQVYGKTPSEIRNI
ncbi:MAG: AraC family transcriptional regulator [Monoglobaceae bacterium]